MTAAEKQAVSRRMKKRWRKYHQQHTSAVKNGHLVESQLTLYVQNKRFTLSVPEAVALRDALTNALPQGKPR